MAEENKKENVLTLEELSKKVEEQGKEIAAQKKTIAELNKKNVEIGKQVLENAPKKPVEHKLPADKFKVGEDEYQFTHKAFRMAGHDGILYADEVIHDADMLDLIVKNQYGIVKKIV